MSGKNSPPRQIILQRIRNRIIEYLSLASSFAAQRRYKAVAPVLVPHEVINQWEDWVTDPPDPDFGPPVFTRDEQQAIELFHQTWLDVIANTPDPLPPLEDLLHYPQWEQLRAAAEETLQVFEKRGYLSEEEEIPSS